MGLAGCSETSVRDYHYSLRNNPEERSSHLKDVIFLKNKKHTLNDILLLIFLTVFVSYIQPN